MKFATINGISIHYQFDDAGAGKPLIVFSNSLATDFRIWQDCVDDLSADYSILRYDKRGHGLSGMGTPPYQIDDHVNDLVALMDHLGLSGAVVVGLSVGGLIAQGSVSRPPRSCQSPDPLRHGCQNWQCRHVERPHRHCA